MSDLNKLAERAATVLKTMLDSRRKWLASCERTTKLLEPEWALFEDREGHDVYVSRLYAEHISNARTHRKEIEALETALEALRAQIKGEPMSDLLKLAERVEAGECSNALDVLIEVALFEPCEDWQACRANNAGTKVIYTATHGEQNTFRAGDWTMAKNRKATAASLRAHAAKGDA